MMIGVKKNNNFILKNIIIKKTEINKDFLACNKAL